MKAGQGIVSVKQVINFFEIESQVIKRINYILNNDCFVVHLFFLFYSILSDKCMLFCNSFHYLFDLYVLFLQISYKYKLFVKEKWQNHNKDERQCIPFCINIVNTISTFYFHCMVYYLSFFAYKCISFSLKLNFSTFQRQQSNLRHVCVFITGSNVSTIVSSFGSLETGDCWNTSRTHAHTLP